MVKIFTVKFRINNGFWFKPGKIVFCDEHFELKFLWTKRSIIPYNMISSIKKRKHMLEKSIHINSRDASIDLILPLRSESLLSQFKSLGFTIDD